MEEVDQEQLQAAAASHEVRRSHADDVLTALLVAG